MINKINKPKNMVFAAYLTQLRLNLPLRKNRPVFKKEVAVEAGVNISSYSMAENGVVPGDSVLYRLSKYFNVPVDNFKSCGIKRVLKGSSIDRAEKNTLHDDEGLWEETRDHEIEAVKLRVTQFEPKNGEAQNSSIIDSIKIDARIFQAILQQDAIISNQSKKLKALQDECDDLKKRIDALEKLYENSSPGPVEGLTKGEGI